MTDIRDLITSVTLSVPIDTTGDGTADDFEKMTFTSMKDAETYLSISETEKENENV